MGNTKLLLGKRIQEIRQQKGVKQSELAEMVEIDSKHMSKIECGRCYPSFEVLDKISDKLNVPPSYFLEIDHLKPKEELIKAITEKLEKTSEEKLGTVYKILKEIL